MLIRHFHWEAEANTSEKIQADPAEDRFRCPAARVPLAAA
jgi:hypothetical protein